MKRHFYILLLTFLFITPPLSAQPNPHPPTIIVNVVIDQMKQDYLYRFWDLYGNEGFKKLVNEGYNFANAHYNYYPTYTAAGHACISTGATPSVNGIVANDWIENVSGDKMYCTQDTSVLGIGTDTKAGQMSPKNLKSSTFGDEVKLATNFRSRVFGISMKDRGAILSSGHLSDAAYWFQPDELNFISSSFYMENLPDWVKNFNKRKLGDKYLNQTWKPLLSTQTLEKYTEEDNSLYENIAKGKDTPTFPYELKKLRADNGNKMIMNTPFGNDILMDFTEALIKNEHLGQNKDNLTDVVYVSFSSTDYVGHYFGIRSMELADTYLRLDKNIASLIKLLERQVGKDNFILTLTADHAGADNPRYLSSKKMEAGFLDHQIVKKDLADFLKEKYGEDLISVFTNMQIYLNHDVITAKNLDKNAIVNDILNFLKFKPGIQKAFSSEIISVGNLTDDMMRMYQNGYDPDRCGDIFIMLKPGWLNMSWSDRGTTHGSIYSYDTHVPLLFYGKNISVGKTFDRVTIAQIAPTLSAILGITPPNGTKAIPLIHYFLKD
ncbi:MAG: alkaline phosphatase family protein [Chitinophagales bacterium]|nr:alkaline phosphatase family protein [Chitinophagales bacterium]